MKTRIILVVSFLFIFISLSYSQQYTLSKERILLKAKNIDKSNINTISYLSGYSDLKISYNTSIYNNYCYETKYRTFFDENLNLFSNPENINTDADYGLITAIKNNSIELQKVFNKKKYGNADFCDIDDKDKLIVNYYVRTEHGNYFLDVTNSFSNEININIDFEGRYVIYSTFTGEYLQDISSDSLIFIYDFKNIINDEPAKTELTCRECIKPQITGDYIYYGKKFFYFPGTDAYDWKIYRAPKFNLSKSELLAEYIEIILVSPDNKYILGKKYLYGKETFVILNTETKKFNYILGRDYSKYKYFYSPAFKQFAFDEGNYFIYINYPKEFPFNSIGADAKRERTSKEANQKFWEEYKHQPLLNE